MACPANQTGKEYQIFAQLPSVKFNSNCFGINIVTVAYDNSGGKGPAAWEYI
jgi:hypothetical protein